MLTDEALSVTAEEAFNNNNVDAVMLDNLELPRCINHEKISTLVHGMLNGDLDCSLAAQRISKGLDMYLEQPYLLDPYIGDWMRQLVDDIKKRWLLDDEENSPPLLLGSICSVIYTLCKVRGYKSVLVYLYHSVDDVVPTLIFTHKILSSSSEELGPEGWMIRCVAMLMASVVLLIPFDIQKFEKRLLTTGCSLDMLGKLEMMVVERLLHCNGRERQAAVLFLSALYRRRDYSDRIANLIDSMEIKENCVGWIEFLCALVKNLSTSSRLHHKDHFEQLMDRLDSIPEADLKYNNLLRVSRIKLYKRLSGILDVQRCLMVQMKGVNDNDTIVRMASAKGISSLCKEISSESITVIIKELLESLSKSLNETFPNATTCHGITLTLAEMCRLAVVPVENVDEILKITNRLLTFEVPRGRFALGASVRDAACYIIWAIVRSYKCPVDGKVVETLICVTLFDREVSCRRAAAAAFQELVGRREESVVPNGIDLLTAMDFFNISQPQFAFETISQRVIEIAPNLRSALLNHLLDHCLSSWDRTIRQYAAKLIARLMCDYKEKEIIPELVKHAGNLDDLGALHGAILALAHLSMDLMNQDHLVMILPISESLIDVIPPKMLGWEMIASAICQLIASLALNGSLIVSIPIQTWLSSISLSLQSRDDSLHNLVATQTLPAIVSRESPNSTILTEYFRGIVLPAADKDRNINAQRGFTLAIGAMPMWLFIDRFGPLNRLLGKITNNQTIMIEKRVNSIKSIGTLYSKLSTIPDPMVHEEMIQVLFTAINDYTIDSRGDIGSLIRIAAMQEIPKVFHQTLSIHRERFCGKLLLHIVDKLDKPRVESLRLLKQHSDLELPWEALQENAFNPKEFFSIFEQKGKNVNLLFNGYYDADILKGLISSAGSVNALIANPALELLINLIQRNIVQMSLLLKLTNEEIHTVRMKRSILQVLQRLIDDDKLSCQSLDSILIQNILKIVKDPKKLNMHDLITATSILLKVQEYDKDVKQWVLDASENHEYPRIRKLCTNA